MMKTMKVIAAMMIMAITTAMPVMAGNKKEGRHDKNTKVVVVVNNNKVSHFDRIDNRASRFNVPKKHGYRPDVKTCTFKVSRHDSHRSVVARAERMKGVIDTKWNFRTRELTIIYDAKVTSVRHIMHSVA